MPHVKTAISLETDLLRKMEELARRYKLSRSRIFAIAAEELVRREEKEDLTRRLNEAYGEGYQASDDDRRWLQAAAGRAEDRLRREEEGSGAGPW